MSNLRWIVLSDESIFKIPDSISSGISKGSEPSNSFNTDSMSPLLSRFRNEMSLPLSIDFPLRLTSELVEIRFKF